MIRNFCVLRCSIIHFVWKNFANNWCLYFLPHQFPAISLFFSNLQCCWTPYFHMILLLSCTLSISHSNLLPSYCCCLSILATSSYSFQMDCSIDQILICAPIIWHFCHIKNFVTLCNYMCFQGHIASVSLQIMCDVFWKFSCLAQWLIMFSIFSNLWLESFVVIFTLHHASKLIDFFHLFMLTFENKDGYQSISLYVYFSCKISVLAFFVSDSPAIM